MRIALNWADIEPGWLRLGWVGFDHHSYRAGTQRPYRLQGCGCCLPGHTLRPGMFKGEEACFMPQQARTCFCGAGPEQQVVRAEVRAQN